MPYIDLWLDEGVQKPLNQTMVLILFEQLESFVNCFPLSGTQLERDAARLCINCTFNSPGVPHFGGVCEGLVRSYKKAMWNFLGSQSMKEEQLITIICSVEQLLNNRPLTASSSDAADLEALTPYFFILGRSTRLPKCCIQWWIHCHEKGFPGT